jgi:hypothetical protein
MQFEKYHQPQLVDCFILNLKMRPAKLIESHRPQSVDGSYLSYKEASI